MIKKYILIMLLIGFLQSCMHKDNEIKLSENSPKENTVEYNKNTQIDLVKNFMKWYIQNMNRLYKFKTIHGGSMNVKENEVAENYSVNWKEVEKYLTELKKSGFLSDEFIQNEKQTFIDGEKYFKENPENDEPPYGFDYDHFFLTQEAFEEDLQYIEKTIFKQKQIDKSNVEVRFSLPISGNYKYTLKMINSKWLINKIESTEK